MKFKSIILAGLALFALAGCENELSQHVSFDVQASSAGSTTSGDTLIVSKATPVTFSFSGNPDIISMYSGEAGHEYGKRNLVAYPANQVKAYLSFTATPISGTIPGTLKVLLSTSYTGLTGSTTLNNKKADSTAVVTGQWTDITSLCNLSSTSGTGNKAAVSLQSYLGQQLCIAFQYITSTNTTAQPTWTIANLQVVDSLAGSSPVVIAASAMGFGALDMNSLTSPYSKSGGAGIWNLSNTTSMSILTSGAGQPLNNDWIIANPFVVNKRTPDTGTAVKAIGNRVDNYQYTFNTAGTYLVTFYAAHSNYKYESETIKTLLIKVK
jgi:hypothetical protein